MKLEVNQIWISDTHPHESFKIYAGEINTCAEVDVKYGEPFENQPEGAKIYFWERYDDKAYTEFLLDKLGRTYNTYPYAFGGACGKSSLVSKIKKYNMKLLEV